MGPLGVFPPQTRLYAIRCLTCGHRFKRRLGPYGQPMTKVQCPLCGAGDVKVRLSLLENLVKY